MNMRGEPHGDPPVESAQQLLDLKRAIDHAAIVATTDKRAYTSRLAKALKITLLDGDAVTKLTASHLFTKSGQLMSEQFDGAVKRVDESRRSNDWRQNLHEARASLISGMGVQSTNRNLAASAFFAEQAVLAQPESEQAQVALRLFYLTSAFAAISLDYVLADQAFRSQTDQRQSIIDSIRFGESETLAILPTIRAAIGLAHKYAESGNAVAKQIEYGFYDDADRIPAEIIADYVSRISTSDALFNAAREIERASMSVAFLPYDTMRTDAKSLLGVFLDFNGISREKIAKARPRGGEAIAAKPSAVEPGGTGPLFGDGDSGVKAGPAPDKGSRSV